MVHHIFVKNDRAHSLSFLSPHTHIQQPKLKATTENGGETMNFELGKERTLIGKAYKFTWVIKIGTDVSSGDELDFTVGSDFGVFEGISVVVK
jgi:hypothetical protein